MGGPRGEGGSVKGRSGEKRSNLRSSRGSRSTLYEGRGSCSWGESSGVRMNFEVMKKEEKEGRRGEGEDFRQFHRGKLFSGLSRVRWRDNKDRPRKRGVTLRGGRKSIGRGQREKRWTQNSDQPLI